MSILPIIKGESELRVPCDPFEFSPEQGMKPSQLAVDLTETMIAEGGVGLSAPQLGIMKRVFVIKTNPIVAFFNPVVVNFSSQEDFQKEGCLSFPGLFVKIKRPKSVRVRFQRPDGAFDTMQFNGLTARIIQHEIDHLDGIIFYDRAHPMHRESAFKKWVIFKRRAVPKKPEPPKDKIEWWAPAGIQKEQS